MTRVSWSLWGLAGLLSAAVALFSYRYLAGIGPMSPGVLANLFAKPWLDVHIAGAATALLVGPVQFLPWIRKRRVMHRRLGRVYVVGCLVGGAGGLVVAFGSTAGPIATVGFGSLAGLWILAHPRGRRSAQARPFQIHRPSVIRSFALPFPPLPPPLPLPLFP